jgi:CubicO group peptidase (beta-lactamase class C family)
MISAIDSIIEASIDPQGPGLAVAVVQNGDCLHCKGYGLAHLEWSTPITADTVFRLGSFTKTFTATAVLLLYQQGKLNLSDAITKYFPDFPPHWNTITIEHLLAHTSGIKNYNDLDGFIRIWSRADLTPRELAMLFADLPLEFMPGTQFAYTNSGYVLLGLLIETLAGMSYDEFIRIHIFAPLRMDHSYYMLRGSIIPQRAAGYVLAPQSNIYAYRGYLHAPFRSMTTSYASGGLGSTLNDLLIWDSALRTNRLLSEDLQKRALTPITLTNGQVSNYGLGWFVENRMGQRIAYHPGDVEGFTTLMVRFLDYSRTLILLANLSNWDLEGLAMKIYEALL